VEDAAAAAGLGRSGATLPRQSRSKVKSVLGMKGALVEHKLYGEILKVQRKLPVILEVLIRIKSNRFTLSAVSVSCMLIENYPHSKKKINVKKNQYAKENYSERICNSFSKYLHATTSKNRAQREEQLAIFFRRNLASPYNGNYSSYRRTKQKT